MAETKMTQKEMFAEVIKTLNGEGSALSNEALIEFIEGRIDVLSRKSGNRKPTKTQKENEVAKERIADVLREVGNPMVVSEILPMVDFSDLECKASSQKVSALLKQMVEAGIVVKTSDKKKSYFSLA